MAGAGDTETVTIIRPAGRDAFGDETGPPVEFDVDGCMFAPRSSEESGFASEQVRSTGAVYAPPGTQVLPTDRVRIRGQVYAVVGQPAVWGTFGVVIEVHSVVG